MPTLLQINVASNYGSTGKIVEQLGLLAESNGWNCYIAHGARYVNPSKLKTIQIETECGEKFHGLWYSLLQDKHGLGSIRATKRLIQKIQTDIKPDIIHLHNIHGYYLNYKLLFNFLSKQNIPVVWTLHDCWTYTGHCAYYTMANCMKWKTGCNTCPCLKDYPKSLFVDRSIKNYQEKKQIFTTVKNITFVPVSYWLANDLSQSFFSGSPIHTIHNGIALDTFTPQPADTVISKYNLYDKTVLLGVAAPWTARKGLNDFLKLRELLPERYALIMVGLSPKQVAELPDGIIGIERTQNVNELAQLYSAADIFINTTYEDNYPTVNLEAIACGTPVITYRTGGSPESVTPQTGRVVDQGNMEQLVQAIRELETSDREQMRLACRIYAEANFDKQKCFQEYIDLYNNILNK